MLLKGLFLFTEPFKSLEHWAGVMEIIQAIGLNSTMFYQLGIFLVVYFLINIILFKPYAKAQAQRASLTTGSDAEAVNILEKVEKLENDFGVEAKEHNQKIKTIFSESEVIAKKEATQIVAVANTKTKEFLTSQREEIKNQVSKAKQHLTEEVPGISAAIAGQLLGKDVH